MSSVFSSKRQTSHEEEQMDRISTLPESVISHILSFLPTKDAVKTILVPGFGNLWTCAHNLSFDHCSYHVCGEVDYDNGPEYNERFLNLIRHVLLLHQTSTIQKFHLKFEFSLFWSLDEEGDDDFLYASKEKRMADEITTWIYFVMRRKVKFLDLDLLGCGINEAGCSYNLPNVVLNNDYLIKLNLAGFAIRSHGQINLKSLGTILLKRVFLNDKIMGEILNGCPLLEELSLEKCYGLGKLNITNPNTKNLIVIHGFRESWLEISCPNIKSLKIAGSIDYVYLKNASSVIDTSVYFSHSFKCACKDCREVRLLFKKLSRSRIFTPCTWCILVLTIWKFTNFPCPFFYWRSLVLNVSLTKWHLPGISSLLRNSPYLETLTMYICPGCYDIFKGDDQLWIQAYDFDDVNYWNSQEANFTCLTHHLKTIMIYGYITEPYVIELVEFLLKRATVLEKMVFSTSKTLQPEHPYYFFAAAVDRQKHHFTSEKLLAISQRLLSIPRASTRAVIHFSC
ncbi:hypothetical protein F0562_010905 [Nyssa sinensis]|uniref:FBD domain-containing protein n=1 Tax=Nyssa sinensis TaxID=561372 RepID=A0A5J5A3U5_9ASTE|nr:hypothetical protein F0562_010905 [Nyssa sinensis]